MAVKTCPKCNAEYELHERFCSIDGAVLRGPGTGVQLEGTIVGGHEILRLLGEGGMGQVYLARSIRTGRLDALKIMRPELAQSADAVSRFNREAMNAVRIQHPNVAIVYDVGDTEDGVPYLAMEYVDGESLQDILDHAPTLHPVRTAAIIRQIADALQAAHQMGIVHRDLKPGNVMIAHRDAADVIKLVDFGISKVVGAADQQLTSSGVIIGSPAYMSPEQVVGGAPITSQSDLYALALVAYRMLTGRLPFNDGSDGMLARVVERPLSLAEARPDVAWGHDIEQVFAKCLAQNPADRPGSAREFAADFDRAISGIQSERPTLGIDGAALVHSRKRGGLGSLRRWGPLAGILAGGFGIAMLVGVGFWSGSNGLGGPANVRKPEEQPLTAPALGDAAKGTGPGPGRAQRSSVPDQASEIAAPTTPAAQRSATPTPVSFVMPVLRVRTAALSVAAWNSVDSAIRIASNGAGIVRTDNGASVSGDLEFAPEPTGRLVVRGGPTPAASVAVAADSVLAFLRFVLASRYLDALRKRGDPTNLTFNFDQPGGDMRVGDSFRFRLRSATGGYLAIFDVAPSGNLTVLNPGSAVADLRQLAPNVETLLPTRERPPIATGPPAGPGQLWALVTSQPLNLPPTINKDAPRAAKRIVDEIQRLARAGDLQWSAVVLPYELKVRR